MFFPINFEIPIKCSTAIFKPITKTIPLPSSYFRARIINTTYPNLPIGFS